jgi:hypothetical protein
MITLIRKLLNAFFLIIFLLLSAPTLLFLTKWYYSNLVMNKTYVGVVTLPKKIEKSEEIVSAAKNLFASADIKAVILHCDGQGGIPGACQAISSDLSLLKKNYQKPVVAFIEKECTGGSYLIASIADEIVSTQGAIIGDFEFMPLAALEAAYSPELALNYSQQFDQVLQKNRRKIIPQNIALYKKQVATGLNLFSLGFVDVLGGSLEIEKILRSKKLVYGSIEKIHGSFIEHFLFYTSDLIHRIISNYKRE